MAKERATSSMLIPEAWIRKYIRDTFRRSDGMDEVIDIMLSHYAAEKSDSEYKVGYDENGKRRYKTIIGKAAALSLANEKLETSDHISIKKVSIFRLNE